MKVSVITVAFNALPELRKTMESVIRQDYPDVEYIVVDGASTDGTRQYLESNGQGLSKWISEPDSGIYEAMNKGTRMASGDYCIYMNAGDCFVGNHVITEVSRYLDGTDFILGNEIRVTGDGRIIRCFPSRGGFTYETLFKTSVRHQSTFIRRSVALSYPYDESLRLVSDWKFILERFVDGSHSFKSIDVDICFFLDGGATQQFKEKGLAEKRSVLEKYPEYRHIWQTPYKPSFRTRVEGRLMLYAKRLEYGKVVRSIYGE